MLQITLEADNSIVDEVDLFRFRINNELESKNKSALGQYFTPAPICRFMASLFDSIPSKSYLLDPGCGTGGLTSAFIEEAINRNEIVDIEADLYDIEPKVKPYITEVKNLCSKSAKINFIEDDFILNFDTILNESFFNSISVEKYSHAILNPPYKKIATKSNHRICLRKAGVEIVNIYAGFVALSILQLRKGGELVAIIPRSFCNGLYYEPFRKFILNRTAIKHIHIFESRTDAFSDEDVLQENIIVHLVKGEKQKDVTITSSPTSDFHIDPITNTYSATDMTIRSVPISSIVNQHDRNLFIHIAANNRDQAIIDKLSIFTSTLDDLNIEVSTGPVVDFRLKNDLRENYEDGLAPLLYPIHFKNGFKWPQKTKKPNAINISKKSRKWLWDNTGYFVITKRFSSKEENRRIVASIYDGTLPGRFIGFENKLNVFHHKKKAIEKELALGLMIFLNCTLVDKYYRLFGGHTQVNATDLRAIKYPDFETLIRLGKKVDSPSLSQKEIDDLIEKEIIKMTGNDNNNPIEMQNKIDQALQILIDVGMPRAQQNERSALTLLALLNLTPQKQWSDAESPMIGVTPIMDWCLNEYGKEYAPNTRETFRRQTLHQFVDGGVCLYNPDKPDRPVNSPKACYQITPELLKIIKHYGTTNWTPYLNRWLKKRKTLVQKYAKSRDMAMIPLTLDTGEEILLSPGDHSQLICDIVNEFGQRFVPGAEVIYLGDTGAKEEFFNKEKLEELGVTVNRKGKLPDVVLYWQNKDWLLLIESVTSHGPVDSKRHSELSELFKNAKPGLVYVTAFPNRSIMAKYLTDISWETEVWTADTPTHLIHFNGDRFLGPHNNNSQT